MSGATVPYHLRPHKAVDRLGNFWVDLTRITLWVLVPISFVAAIVLGSLAAFRVGG